jgi:hypothetical protein
MQLRIRIYFTAATLFMMIALTRSLQAQVEQKNNRPNITFSIWVRRSAEFLSQLALTIWAGSQAARIWRPIIVCTLRSGSEFQSTLALSEARIAMWRGQTTAPKEKLRVLLKPPT